MKQEYFHDRDMTMLAYTHNNGVKFSICNKIGSRNYLVQCTQLGIYFTVDNTDMGVKVMKTILDKGEKVDKC